MPPSADSTANLQINERARAWLWENIRAKAITATFANVIIMLPSLSFPTCQGPADNPCYQLHRPLQSVISEYVRRSRSPLPVLIEPYRCHTAYDYRPNKNIVPALVQVSCASYNKLPQLMPLVQEGIRVTLRSPMPTQTKHPPNHPSALKRLNVLRKNIRKEQDHNRCIVVDLDVAQYWPELFLSPFGVVDKGDGNPFISGRVIHDLSYPEGVSMNDHTEKSLVPATEYEHCDRVTREILAQKAIFQVSP